MYFLLNLGHYIKSCGHFCQILAFFMMPAHQIWSYHVTQEANFENVLFCHNSTFNIRKVTKFQVEKLSTSQVIDQKPHGGVENTPVLLGLCISQFQAPTSLLGQPPGFCTLLLPRGRDLYLMTFPGGRVFAYP